jgi:hypothetical protein
MSNSKNQNGEKFMDFLAKFFFIELTPKGLQKSIFSMSKVKKNQKLI